MVDMEWAIPTMGGWRIVRDSSCTQHAEERTMVANSPIARETLNRYQVSIDQYIAFRRDGFLIVRDLVSKAEVDELREHTEDLMQGRLPEQQEAARYAS